MFGGSRGDSIQKKPTSLVSPDPLVKGTSQPGYADNGLMFDFLLTASRVGSTAGDSESCLTVKIRHCRSRIERKTMRR